MLAKKNNLKRKLSAEMSNLIIAAAVQKNKNNNKQKITTTCCCKLVTNTTHFSKRAIGFRVKLRKKHNDWARQNFNRAQTRPLVARNENGNPPALRCRAAGTVRCVDGRSCVRKWQQCRETKVRNLSLVLLGSGCSRRVRGCAWLQTHGRLCSANQMNIHVHESSL